MKYIRELELKDASLMHTCFADKDNVKFLKIGQSELTLEQCEKFIKKRNSNTNYNFAIVDEFDDWCGTISLKNVDLDNLKAEYAIVTSRKIQGTGLARNATRELIDFAFHKLGLIKIYLNVITTNERAIKFYEKNGFEKCGFTHKSVRIIDSFYDLYWYELMNKDH